MVPHCPTPIERAKRGLICLGISSLPYDPNDYEGPRVRFVFDSEVMPTRNGVHSPDL